ncbi:MAG TPA: hypothetical protein VMX94_07575 [Armatimonadota bacterium]|nr:hypothetical protein [Armatimonadota bacterium]
MAASGRYDMDKVDRAMDNAVYDVPIGEVARILEKSDRQVRRYVKQRRLTAKPVRVDGHIKLMFNREETLAYKERLAHKGFSRESAREIIADTHLIGDTGGARREIDAPQVSDADMGESGAVKYVIDTLREQIQELRKENQELHYQLEQRSGQVGFLQGKVEFLQEEVKMLMPAMPSQEEIIARKPWYRRIFGRR